LQADWFSFAVGKDTGNLRDMKLRWVAWAIVVAGFTLYARCQRLFSPAAKAYGKSSFGLIFLGPTVRLLLALKEQKARNLS
jgi:hypothetical protein